MRYVVRLTYETSVILELPDGHGPDWERDAALQAESLIDMSQMELTDYDVRAQKGGDKRPAANV